ncbi:GNAT family N-acetyltransferase [Endozoicomonas sp. SCSIO W0465]|uniref:GNAT family N-acetyltransferase n=1 Tax=Endozoicomonas sp. SCSIO W0465 TaxID=2918516 RepID=UPI002074C859|nr:GNAT family N-acetyltransferase [Endozoicomonas sp. SCSIO W0465]USE35833.1 GNAT family N-acetyltransferase [Endozoicomonas sp. SCSIO W0465]
MLPSQTQIKPCTSQGDPVRVNKCQSTLGNATFSGRLITVLDRASCDSDKDLELVNFVNKAYDDTRISFDNKSNPTQFYFCLTEGGKLLACAGYMNGAKAVTKVAKLDKTDCYISPFAALNGNGYGKHLLKEIEQRAKDQGFNRMVFDVWNEAPQDMNPYYVKYGCEKGDTVKYTLNGKENSTTRYVKDLS